jgi:hypothetical protein
MACTTPVPMKAMSTQLAKRAVNSTGIGVSHRFTIMCSDPSYTVLLTFNMQTGNLRVICVALLIIIRPRVYGQDNSIRPSLPSPRRSVPLRLITASSARLRHIGAMYKLLSSTIRRSV